MWKSIGKHRGLLLVLGLWIVVIAILVGVSLSRGDGEEPRHAGEDAVISVTGTGVFPSNEVTEPALTSGPSDGSNPSGRNPSPDQPRETARRKLPNPPTATGRPAETHRVHVTESPKTTGKPQETDKPEPTAATYTFTIECSRILDRPELWRDGLEEVIPPDGVFYHGERSWKKGESVYDALTDICEENNILLDSQYTPIYETYYVSGIGNLYEFDCGSESGWKYSVNGALPGMGCSRYIIGKGDTVIFFYDYRI